MIVGFYVDNEEAVLLVRNVLIANRSPHYEVDLSHEFRTLEDVETSVEQK
jgi:hypothetical protein